MKPGIKETALLIAWTLAFSVLVSYTAASAILSIGLANQSPLPASNIIGYASTFGAVGGLGFYVVGLSILIRRAFPSAPPARVRGPVQIEWVKNEGRTLVPEKPPIDWSVLAPVAARVVRDRFRFSHRQLASLFPNETAFVDFRDWLVGRTYLEWVNPDVPTLGLHVTEDGETWFTLANNHSPTGDAGTSGRDLRLTHTVKE